jgi:hypothetical protein
METSINIYYLLLGDLISKSVLYETPKSGHSNTPTQAKDIFNRISILKNTNTNLINQRNKIPSGNLTKTTFYYFYLTDNYIFIFLESDSSVNASAFSFIEDIVGENIHLMTNDHGSLNNNGKIKIRNLLAKYQKSTTLVTNLTDLDEINLGVKETELHTFENLRSPRGVKIKTLKENVEGRGDTNTCKNNWKMILVISVIIAVLLVVIILPIVLSRIATTTTSSAKP